MPPVAAADRMPTRRGIRLAIVDDNPFVRAADGTVHPRAATFHRFAEAVVAAGPFLQAAYLIPVATVAPGEAPPELQAVDEARLRVVPTRAFRGIAGYAARWPVMTAHNAPVVRQAVAGADLVWIKAPASNALLAAAICRIAGVPRFTYIAGSVSEVVAGGSRRGIVGILARPLAAGYDAATAALARTGPAVRLDGELFTSVVDEEEIGETERRGLVPRDGRLRIAWAGRLVADKGVDDLLLALRHLCDRGVDASVTVLGDGPARPDLEATARGLGVATGVDWRGFVADRAAYLDALRGHDLFVLSSRTEGVPKVVVDAMAAGVPIVATRVGAVAELLADGRFGRLVAPTDAAALADAIESLAGDEAERGRLRHEGLMFARAHTRAAQAQRLVDWMRATFPALPWDAPAEAT